jgi:hypothetical protein
MLAINYDLEEHEVHEQIVDESTLDEQILFLEEELLKLNNNGPLVSIPDLYNVNIDNAGLTRELAGEQINVISGKRRLNSIFKESPQPFYDSIKPPRRIVKARRLQKINEGNQHLVSTKA